MERNFKNIKEDKRRLGKGTCKDIKDKDVQNYPDDELIPLPEITKDSSFVIEKPYYVSRKLGSGFTANVYEVLHLENMHKLAIKYISKERLKIICPETVFEEIFWAIKSIKDPYIVHYKRLVDLGESYVIVMEYCEGGALDITEFELTPPSENIRKKIMYQLLQAVNTLHQNGIIHRDIKLGNMLYKTNEKRTNPRIALADFEMSLLFRKSRNSDHRKSTKILGTKIFMAPECFDGIYSTASDMWSCGIVLKYLFMSELRYKNTLKESNSLAQENLNKDIISKIPTANDLMLRLLNLDPKKRITSSEALEHQWFQEYHSADSQNFSNNYFFSPTATPPRKLGSSMIYSINPRHSHPKSKQNLTTPLSSFLSPLRIPTKRSKLSNDSASAYISSFVGNPSRPLTQTFLGTICNVHTPTRNSSHHTDLLLYTHNLKDVNVSLTTSTDTPQSTRRSSFQNVKRKISRIVFN